MEKAQTIEDFYKDKFNWIPENIKKEIGHFNVFKLDDFIGKKAKPMPYNRKDYYKISLIVGKNRVHYADKVITMDKQALLFATPHIPYNWEQIDEKQTGYFCVFTEAFFYNYGNLKNYPVFKPEGTPIFAITDEQMKQISSIYERMFVEMTSDYTYKYDVLRNLTFELIHSAMKMEPANLSVNHFSNASNRISTLFLELLERQFPIEDVRQKIQFRSAADFARQLSVHTNHLNKALKETSGKTTTAVITERILQEAKILLKRTHWNISEIAHSLGFTEATHFNNFFKKHTDTTPLNYRNI